jgi:hypothetical protein
MNFLLRTKHVINYYTKQEDIPNYLWKISKPKFKDFCKSYKKGDKIMILGLI